MKISLFFILFSSILFSCNLCQIYVNPDANCTICNGSLSFPFKDLKSAISSIPADVQIILMDGVHHTNNLLISNRSLALKSMNGANVTIIDGNNTNSCLNLVYGSFTINGITLRNCKKEYNSGTTAENIVNQNNSGGALYIQKASVSIFNMIFIDNEAESGGAIAFVDGSFMIFKCLIKNNKAKNGGALFIQNAQVSISYSEINENSAQLVGGGIILAQGSMSIYSYCKLQNNMANNSYNQAGAFENSEIVISDHSVYDKGFVCRDNSTISEKSTTVINLCNSTQNNTDNGNSAKLLKNHSFFMILLNIVVFIFWI